MVGGCSRLSWGLAAPLCPDTWLTEWKLECCSLDFKEGSATDATRRLLGWFCPTGMGQLGTKQVAPQLPRPVVSWVANKAPSQLRSLLMLQKLSENSWAAIT